MKQIRKRLTYANVMSSIAVFFVLGGGAAFAANELAKNSVGAKQLRKNAVATAKIKNGAVTGAKIKNGAITTDKIGADAVTGDKVNESTLGEVPKATNASSAIVGGPAAYAQITAIGGVATSEPSRGIVSADVSRPATGYYCIELAFKPVTASVGGVAENSEDSIFSFNLGAPYEECPATAEVEVYAWDAGEAEPDNEPFWIQLDQ